MRANRRASCTPRGRPPAAAILGLCLAAAALSTSCAHTRWQANFVAGSHPESIDRGAPFLKAHLRDGSVLVMSSWQIDGAGRALQGDGVSYDVNRRPDRYGTLTAPLADVVLFETNRPYTVHSAGPAVMGVVSGVSLVVSGACLATGSCFGGSP